MLPCRGHLWQPAHEKISTELESKIKNSANSAIPVIVQTQRGLQEKHKTRIQQLGGEIKQDLSLIEGFSADLSASAIKDLSKDEDIVGISYDAEVNTCLDIAVPAINAPAAWTAGIPAKYCLNHTNCP